MRRPGIRRVIWIYALTVLAFSAMESTYSLLVTKRYNLDMTHVNYLFAYIGVLVVLVQGGMIGRLTRAFGEKRLLVAGLVLQTVGLAALPFAATTVGLVLATAPLAVGSGLSQPSLASLLSRFAPPDDQGGTLGIGESAAAVGRVVGPVSGTWTFQNVGMAFPYVVAAGLMVVSAIVAAALRPADVARKELADAGAA